MEKNLHTCALFLHPTFFVLFVVKINFLCRTTNIS